MTRIHHHPVLPPPEPRREVSFRFDGQLMHGLEGETVSSALFANGVRTFSVHPRGDAPRGIFCANGQCAQCTVIIDGIPQKSCVTPLQEGMEIHPLHHLPHLPADDTPPGPHLHREADLLERCEVLVVGAGPAGLTATLELAGMGYDVILVDDKDHLGGKLVLQTHKFFGSIEDCYAGTRGVDIATRLEQEVRAHPQVRVFTEAHVVGLFSDGRAGVFLQNRGYRLVDFEGLVVSAGARERSLVFPGNDLPGVYGAGAFQTLVNRDRVRAAERVFVVGSGNVGLIAAYHALQAGIEVVGIVDILPRVTGYAVHADKIRRLGVPIRLSHTILSAEGEGRVERITIAEVDEDFTPLLDTALTFEVDTLLIAVGLTPVDEFYRSALRFGAQVVKAGDAEAIAEASSAMFGGRIAALELARKLGREVEMDPSYTEKAEILRSPPGRTHPPRPVELGERFRPVFHCHQEIPCNPCTSVCPVGAVALDPVRGDLLDVPHLAGECTGCRLCVAICPGLAITLARRLPGGQAEVVLAHEFEPDFEPGDLLPLAGLEGEPLGEGEVLRISRNRKYRTHLVHVRTSAEHAPRVAGIRVQDPAVTRPLDEPSLEHLPEEGIVCRCERVTLRETLDHIRTYQVRDVNQLKQARVGMGACGGKTCSALLPRIFRMAGVDWNEVEPGTLRPLAVEVPMHAIVNEEREDP